MDIFDRALLKSEREAGIGLVAALDDFCAPEKSGPPHHCPVFCHEKSSNRGWMADKKNGNYILLIDFRKQTLLVVISAFCSLTPSDTIPGQVDLRIKGAHKGDDGMWIRNLVPNVRQWLESWDRAPIGKA